MKKIASAFLVASLGGIAALGLNHLIQNQATNNNSQLSYHPPVKLVNLPTSAPENTVDFTVAAEMSVHSVVNVKTTYSSRVNQSQ